MGKVVLLTGAPGVGKSTFRTALAYRFPALQAFDYGKLLLERKAAEGVKMEYRELREKSSSVITPTDVGSIDDWVIQRISELRQHSDVVLDSHALTAESYGLRQQCQSLLHGKEKPLHVGVEVKIEEFLVDGFNRLRL
jgi:adenylate kinase